MPRGKKSEEVEKKDPLLDDESEAESAEKAEKDEAESEEQVEEAKPEKKPKKADEKAEAPAKPALNLADHKAVAEATRAKLMAEPKVNFIVPLAAGEKEGAAEMVQINGFRMNIKKGVMVEIPMSIAKILANHYKIEMTAGADKRLDRGADVADALS